MKIKKLLILLAIVSIGSFTTTACDNNDGPAEKAGHKVDAAAKDVGNAIEDACEKVKKGADAEDTDC